MYSEFMKLIIYLHCDFFHSIRFKVNKVGRKRSPIFYFFNFVK